MNPLPVNAPAWVVRAGAKAYAEAMEGLADRCFELRYAATKIYLRDLREQAVRMLAEAKTRRDQ